MFNVTPPGVTKQLAAEKASPARAFPSWLAYGALADSFKGSVLSGRSLGDPGELLVPARSALGRHLRREGRAGRGHPAEKALVDRGVPVVARPQGGSTCSDL